MDGRARLTIVKSRIGRNAPVSNTAKASHFVGIALFDGMLVAMSSSCVDELIYPHAHPESSAATVPLLPIA